MVIVKNNLFLKIKETNANIIIKRLPVISATKTGMIQLFQNLVSNAIKFRKKDTTPVIEISCKEKTDEFVFKVKDNGIGIDEQFQERIFGIFNQLHSRDKYKGSGIGLAICKRVIENMGGKIQVESSLGEGATFIVIIPKKPEFTLNLDL